jgi:hypothetical protein
MADPARVSSDPGERRQWLQQSAADFRQFADLLDGKPPASETPVVASPPASPGVAASDVPAARPIEQPSAAPTARVSQPFWVDALLVAAILAAIAALAGVLWRRRHRRAPLTAIDPEAASEADNSAPAEIFRKPVGGDTVAWASLESAVPDFVRPEPGIGAGAASVAPVPETLVTAAPASPQMPPSTRFSPPPGELGNGALAAGLEVSEEPHGVIELAEIMLAFGRVKGAAEILHEFVDHSPREALQPWIKLLEVYRANNMRREFESVSERLNKIYNVQVESWDADEEHALAAAGEAARGNPGARSLMAFPHVMERIERLWGTDECRNFLTDLLHDNRGGERIGFRREVAEEILFLSDIIGERLRAAE